MAYCGDTAEANRILLELIIRYLPLHYHYDHVRNTLTGLGVPDNDIRVVFKEAGKNFGVARFLDRQAAQNAIRLCNNQTIEGNEIKVYYSRKSDDVGQVLYVTNFSSYYCTDDRLKTLLEQNEVRHIAMVRVINDPHKQLFAYVSFNLQEYARQALDKIDGAIMGGTKLKALTCSRHLNDPRMPQVTIAIGSKNLNIRNFPKEDDTDDRLRGLLEELGVKNIVNLTVLQGENYAGQYNNAFASFPTVEDADAALKILDGVFVEGRCIQVRFSATFKTTEMMKATTPPAPSTDLFITNVSSTYDTNEEFWEKLELLGANNLVFVQVFDPSRRGNFGQNCYAKVSCLTVEDATAALGVLNGALIDGRRIKVQFSKEKAFRPNLLPDSIPTAPTTCPYLRVTNIPEAYDTDDKLKLLLDRNGVRYIASVRVLIDPFTKLYAYVAFIKVEHARQALVIVDGIIVDVNKKLKAEQIIKTEYPEMEQDLHVSNFHEAYCIGDELRKLLELLGVTNIASVRVMHVPNTEFRQACVTFYSEEYARQALRRLDIVDRTMEGGNKIKAKPMTEHLKDLGSEKTARGSVRARDPVFDKYRRPRPQPQAARGSARTRDANDEKYRMPPLQPQLSPASVPTAPTTCRYLRVTNFPKAYATDVKLRALLYRSGVVKCVSVQVVIEPDAEPHAYVKFNNEDDARRAFGIVNGLRVDRKNTLEATRDWEEECRTPSLEQQAASGSVRTRDADDEKYRLPPLQPQPLATPPLPFAQPQHQFAYAPPPPPPGFPEDDE